MRDPANMPKLQKDAPAVAMHGVGDPAPAGDLLFGIYARRARVAFPLRRNLRCLGDDQPGRGALAIILDV